MENASTQVVSTENQQIISSQKEGSAKLMLVFGVTVLHVRLSLHSLGAVHFGF